MNYYNLLDDLPDPEPKHWAVLIIIAIGIALYVYFGCH